MYIGKPIATMLILTLEVNNTGDCTLGSDGVLSMKVDSENTHKGGVYDWMYLLIALLIAHGDLLMFYKVLSPSTSSTMGLEAQEWYNYTSHEQVCMYTYVWGIYM